MKSRLEKEDLRVRVAFKLQDHTMSILTHIFSKTKNVFRKI